MKLVSDGFLLKREDHTQKDLSNLDRNPLKLSEATIRKFRILRIEGARDSSVVRIFQTTDSDRKSFKLTQVA